MVWLTIFLAWVAIDKENKHGIEMGCPSRCDEDHYSDAALWSIIWPITVIVVIFWVIYHFVGKPYCKVIKDRLWKDEEW